ncbi:hypothetical protein MPTK1_8g07740 [Marchantia polymorpha subsp. ruderalis]|nr:hypothetical protein MARPO_0013s0021 [Marchantia polymorpha]BBN19083.1 hypothetical protein Mp_8g07740 [Marchantia polymorpha subsp. ruderalis]|eukprot:PTQ45763.1 hypothetical protein MARPO_0013s0021 [Marchantia polymorpha]
MNLDQPEAEELLLKRCWLSRYWGLAARLGVYADIAHGKHSLWASLAPSPFEFVVAAAEKALEAPALATSRELRPSTSKRPHRHLKTMGEIIASEEDAGSMLAVDKALREMAMLRVEEAVLLAMTDHRHPAMMRVGLSVDEAEDVQFKQAWLLYFWSRAKWLGLERDLADERVLYWTQRRHQPPTFRDTVDVEKGLLELQKLGLDKQQLWEEAPPRDELEIAHPIVAI